MKPKRESLYTVFIRYGNSELWERVAQGLSYADAQTRLNDPSVKTEISITSEPDRYFTRVGYLFERSFHIKREVIV